MIKKIKLNSDIYDATKTFGRSRAASAVELNKVIEDVNEEISSIETSLSTVENSIPSRPYKIIAGAIASTGANIFSAILQNEVGAVTWTRVSTGLYRISGASGVIPNDRSLLFLTLGSKGTNGDTTARFVLGDGSYADVNIYAANGTTLVDGFSASFEIRVYDL